MYKCVLLGKLTLLKFSGISESSSDPLVSLCKAKHVPVSDAPPLSVCSAAQFNGGTFTLVSCTSCEFDNNAYSAASSDIPYVFCNICASTQCAHSPSIVNNGGAMKLSYSSDVIAQGVIPSFAAPRSFSVPLNIMSYNCMHMADDENDNMVSNERALFLDSLVEHFFHDMSPGSSLFSWQEICPRLCSVCIWPSQPQSWG